MAQQQPPVSPVPARSYSPPQPVQSPITHHSQGLTLPPSTQPRVSPIPSPAQAASPYQPPQAQPYQQQQPQHQQQQAQHQQQQHQQQQHQQQQQPQQHQQHQQQQHQQHQQQQQQLQHQQQFVASPGASPMNSAAASPSYPNMALPAQNSPYPNNTQYQSHAPYQNGVTTPSLALPDSRQSFTSTPTTPLAPATPNPQYTPAMLAPIAAPATPAPVAGGMGPPSKPAERPTKEYEYDATDSLAGTGINIRDEEQALLDYYAGNFGQDSRYGFPANPPGSKASFYGAGVANQPAQPTDATTQEKLAAQAAERAWNDSAHNLASIRSNELKNPFLLIAVLHRKARDICKKNDINLNLDLKNPSQPMGKMKPAEMWSAPELAVSTKPGPDGALVTTAGSFIPHDAYLVDQLALLSLATKHRIRDKLEEGFHIATTRQKTSHGAVPTDWADVAAPIPATGGIVASLDSASRVGGESAVSPRTNLLKRSLDASTPGPSPNTAKATPVTSVKDSLASTLRENSTDDRSLEEARLRKRQKRVNPESATSASRAGSVAPGTPGTVAPEPDKQLSKKEQKELKKAAGGGRGGRVGVTDTSTATANQTLQHLMGGFGGRNKGKKYSWMTAGASGASTPARLNTTDLPGTPGAAANKTPQQARLTLGGKQRLGTWREDGDKGKQIQLRDWLTVMEIDGLELKAIQEAYIKLDGADSTLG